MGVARLERGAAQPFYHVLPDPQDRPGQVSKFWVLVGVEGRPA